MQDDQSGGGEGRVTWVVKGMEEAVVWVAGWVGAGVGDYSGGGDGWVAVMRV